MQCRKLEVKYFLILLMLASPLVSGSAYAYKGVRLMIVNPNPTMERVQVMTQPGTPGGGCISTTKPPMNQIMEIKPGETVEIYTSRRQGGGCDGRQGYFKVDFAADLSPKGHASKDAPWKVAFFEFSNDGGLRESIRANGYRGVLKLLRNEKWTQTYQYTMMLKKVRNPPVIRSWEIDCNALACGNTEKTVITTEETGQTKGSKTSRTDELVKSAELSFGAEKSGISAGYKDTTTKTQRNTLESSVLNTIKNSETTKTTTKWLLTPQELIAGNISTVWRLRFTFQPPILPHQPENKFSVRTNWVACTKDTVPPKAFPGSPGYQDCTPLLRKL
jgi:hypothetical protein